MRMRTKQAPRPAGPALEDVGLEPLVTLPPHRTVAEARDLITSGESDGIVIVHPGGVPVAVFGREHLQSPPLPRGVPWDELMVGPYARRSRIVFTPQTSVRDAVRVMHRRRVTVVPVRKNGKIVAMVSRRHLETSRRQAEH